MALIDVPESKLVTPVLLLVRYDKTGENVFNIDSIFLKNMWPSLISINVSSYIFLGKCALQLPYQLRQPFSPLGIFLINAYFEGFWFSVELILVFVVQRWMFDLSIISSMVRLNFSHHWSLAIHKSQHTSWLIQDLYKNHKTKVQVQA